jgi:hypothetical protein
MDLNSCADISEMIFWITHPEEQEVIKKPKGANKMYAVGEWIRVADCCLSSVDFTGYILESDRNTRKYKIKLTKNKHGKSVDITTTIHEDGIYSADLEDGFDTSFLLEHELDWCLVWKNEARFFELIKELENKGGKENVER